MTPNNRAASANRTQVKNEAWMVLKWREKKSTFLQYIPFRGECPPDCHDSIEIEVVASGLCRDEAFEQARKLELAQRE